MTTQGFQALSLLMTVALNQPGGYIQSYKEMMEDPVFQMWMEEEAYETESSKETGNS